MLLERINELDQNVIVDDIDFAVNLPFVLLDQVADERPVLRNHETCLLVNFGFIRCKRTDRWQNLSRMKNVSFSLVAAILKQ